MNDDDDSSSFTDIISSNFEEIRKNFRKGSQNYGYMYDEDTLAEAFIRCYKVLEKKPISKKEAIKYLWVAYLNGIKTEGKRKNKNVNMPENFDTCDKEGDYNKYIDTAYDIIIKSIYDKFGERDAKLWVEYMRRDRTYNSIAEEGSANFYYIIKKIKKYIRETLPKENKLLLESLYHTDLNYKGSCK